MALNVSWSGRRLNYTSGGVAQRFAGYFNSIQPKPFAPPLYFEAQQKKRLEVSSSAARIAAAYNFPAAERSNELFHTTQGRISIG
jgi:hypothetical protein